MQSKAMCRSICVRRTKRLMVAAKLKAGLQIPKLEFHFKSSLTLDSAQASSTIHLWHCDADSTAVMIDSCGNGRDWRKLRSRPINSCNDTRKRGLISPNSWPLMVLRDSPGLTNAPRAFLCDSHKGIPEVYPIHRYSNALQ